MTDHELFDGLKSGHKASIEKIYAELLPRVVAWVIRNNGSEEDGRDIFQETLEIILFKISEVNSNFEALVISIAKRRWIDRLRKNKSISSVRTEELERLTEEDHGVPLFAAEQIRYLKFKIMEDGFSQLSALCQQLMLMIKKGESVEHIVSQLNFSSANTVYRRKAACMERWSQLIKEHAMYSSCFE